MKDFNKITITGNLGAEPQMRHTLTSSVCNFRVAVNRTWKDATGVQQQETTWFNVVAWSKLGEICNEYLRKGSRVLIEGRLQVREYTDKKGVTRTAIEIIATDMLMLDTKAKAPVAPPVKNAPVELPAEDMPF